MNHSTHPLARDPGAVRLLEHNLLEIEESLGADSFTLDADAHQKKLYIDPVLPRWLPEVTLHKLRVGKARVDLRFWREGEATRHEVLTAEGGLEVEDSSRASSRG